MEENIKIISKLVSKGLGAKDSLNLVRTLNKCNGKSFQELNKNLISKGFKTKLKNSSFILQSTTKNARLQIFKGTNFLMSIDM